jgi:hypothetical protein
MKSVDTITDRTPAHKKPPGRSRVIACIAIFLLAFAVRALTWHDTRLEVGKVQTAVVADYQRVARLLRDGGVRSFFSQSSPLADPNNLGHPPGYSLVIASVYSFKPSDAAIQFVQITLDSLSDVLIFVIVAEWLPLGAGVVAGLLAAFSPQLAWNSVLLLPDASSVLPILLAILLLARAVRNPRLVMFIAIGALVGVSCWLRANALFLSLFFAAATLLIIKERPPAWRFALSVICGTVLVVLPLTMRNAIVFHRFIPLSLGAGQTFLEGIADYDRDGKFGIPNTDMGIMKQEAEIYQRPDYYGRLFNPDGVERERARLSRGFAIVRAHPVWFAGVMARRASSMVRLERSRLISTEPAVTHPINDLDHAELITLITAQQLGSNGVAVPGHIAMIGDDVIVTPGENRLSLRGNLEMYGPQFLSPELAVKSSIDYVVTVPVRISAGRMRVTIEDASGKIYSSQIIERLEHTSAEDQPEELLKLSFVAPRSELVRLVWANEASAAQPLVEIGPIRLYELGPARYVWTRFPRLVIHGIQTIFLTAVILPLAIIGLLILILRKQTTALVILSVVPLYFFIVQSAVHTEYRYVLAVDYFLFAFAGVAVSCLGSVVVKRTSRLSPRSGK